MTVQTKRSFLSGLGLVLGYIRRESGNVAAIMALMLVPLVGALSMGVEASSWFFMSRATQNAADSAAIGAANNGVTATTEYQLEGQANANQYGFATGSNNTTVAISSGVTCPDATTGCYQATVTQKVPIYLTAIVGFRGDTTIGGKPYKTIVSTALAEPLKAITFPTCLTTTGNDSGGSDGLSLKGIPKSNMPGCAISAVGSNSAVDCNGQGVGGNPDIFATGTISGACTTGLASPKGSSSSYIDPYSNYYTNIPCTINSASTGCTSGTTVNCSSFSGTLTAGACYSGDVSISGDISLTPGSPNVVYIKNGNLNLSGNKQNFTTSNIAFVFTGTSPGGLIGGKGGAISMTAPGSGTWSGVATYQDTHLIPTASQSTYTSTAWSQNGGTPTVNIQGLMYLPKEDVSFGGGAGSPPTGVTSSCFIAVLHSFDANGTGLAMTKTGCSADGLGSVPTVQILRASLVQ